MTQQGENSEQEFIRYKRQVTVLKRMSEKICAAAAAEPRQFQIDELAELVGTDEKEVQRSLYILEGHKFVVPYPAGDFTSKIWCITQTGLRAARSLNETNMGLL